MKYDDILYLPHHQSTKHSHMSIYDRAAQFAPFAALTGHEEAVKETGRLTEKMIELDEGEKGKIDGVLRKLQANISAQPKISVTYFVPDLVKNGGSYVTDICEVKKIDEINKQILFCNGTQIRFDSILAIRML